MIGNVQIIKNNGDALSSNGLAHFRFNDSDKEYIIYYLGEETEDGKKKIHVGYINGAVTEPGIGEDESAQITTLLKMVGKGEDVSPIATFLPLASQVFNIHDKVKKVGIPEKVMNNIISEQQKSQIATEAPEVPADKPNTFFDESVTGTQAQTEQVTEGVPNVFEQPIEPVPVAEPQPTETAAEVPSQPAEMQVVQPEALASVSSQFQEPVATNNVQNGTISIDEAKTMMEQMQSEVNELFAKKIQEMSLQSANVVEATTVVETIQPVEPTPIASVEPEVQTEVQPETIQSEVQPEPVQPAEVVQEVAPVAEVPQADEEPQAIEAAQAVETVQPEVAPAVIEEGPIQPEGPILNDANPGVDVVQSLELAPQHDIVPDVLGVESDLTVETAQPEATTVPEAVPEVAPAVEAVPQVAEVAPAVETVQPEVAQVAQSVVEPQPAPMPETQIVQDAAPIPEAVPQVAEVSPVVETVEPQVAPAPQVAETTLVEPTPDVAPVMTNPQMVAPVPEATPAVIDDSPSVIDTTSLIDTQAMVSQAPATNPVPEASNTPSVIDTTQDTLVGEAEPNPLDEPAVVIASEQYSDFSQIPDVTPAQNNDVPVIGPSVDLSAIDTSIGGAQNEIAMPPQLEAINGIPSPEQPPVSLPGNRVEGNDFDLVTSQESFDHNKELVRDQAA